MIRFEGNKFRFTQREEDAGHSTGSQIAITNAISSKLSCQNVKIDYCYNDKRNFYLFHLRHERSNTLGRGLSVVLGSLSTSSQSIAWTGRIKPIANHKNTLILIQMLEQD